MSVDRPLSDPTVPTETGAQLERALADAARSERQEDAQVCAAVEEVVEHAKRKGHPPERVLVMLKSFAYRVLEAQRLSVDAVRGLIAWIVRCAVNAYYREA